MALWLVGMGRDSSRSPGVRTHKPDWKPLSTGRSGNPPSVARTPGSSKGEGVWWFHSHLSPTPKPPSCQQPSSLGALLQFLQHCPPSLHVPRAGTRALQAPLHGHVGRRARQLLHRGGGHAACLTENRAPGKEVLVLVGLSGLGSYSYFCFKYCRKISHLMQRDPLAPATHGEG